MLAQVTRNEFGWDWQDNIKKLIIPAFAWFVVRLFGGFSSSLEDVTVLEDNRYDVAPGLAANCWVSFLEHVVKSDVKGKMQEFTKDLKEAMIGRSEVEFLNPQLDGIRSYDSLIVLLPSNCHRDKKKDLARDEKIYQHIPGLSDSQKYWISVDLPRHVRKDPAKLPVYWIFENSEDEAEYEQSNEDERERNDKPKILFTYDFPQILQSVMGPGKGWEPDKRPAARKRNIEKFKKVIKDLIHTDCYRFRYDIKGEKLTNSLSLFVRNEVIFLKYQNSDKRPPLSHIIRAEIKRREMESFQSSSSGSESDD